MSDKKLRFSETGLADFGLETPPPVFRAETFSRSVAAAFKGVETFSRAQLIEKVEAEHGKFDASVDLERLGFWRAVVSNSSLDSYFTRMAKSSLRNYAADASSPTVSFQNSHRHFELPVGRSVFGQLIETGEVPAGARAEDLFPAVVVDFYSHRDLKLGEVAVEQFLLGVNSHVIKDVSIGFKEGEGFRYTCSICSGNYWSYDCRHIAGVEYDVAPTDANGDPSEGEKVKRLAFIWIENARLSEVSAVYDGATTNAMIIKAEREARAGRLDGETERFLERRFHFRADKNAWTKGFSEETRKLKESEQEVEETERGEKPEEKTEVEDNLTMTEQEIRAAAAKEFAEKVRTTAQSVGLEVTEESAAETVLEAIRSTYAATKSKADKYDVLRGLEIDEAVAQKTRAEGGETFTEEKAKAVRSMLENCDVEAVKEFSSEWRKQGDVRFGKGRSSVDETDDNKDADETGNKKRAEAEGLPEVLKRVNPAEFAGAM